MLFTNGYFFTTQVEKKEYSILLIVTPQLKTSSTRNHRGMDDE